MTDFRPVRCLLAYSGGTVPDFDRIHYSPPVLKAKQAALEQYMKLRVLYTRKTGLSIEARNRKGEALEKNLCRKMWYSSARIHMGK